MNICLTGITGSGASYLAEYIIKNHPDVKIYGIARWGSTKTQENIKHIKDKITLIECDLNDLSSTIRALKIAKPDVIYNLAANANVRVSFDNPISVLQNNIFSTVNLLEATRFVCPEAIFQQCSTSEVCGDPVEFPITENHPLNPCNPYAISKLASEKLTYTYWRSYGLKVVISRAFCYANPKRHDLFGTSFALQIARIEQWKQDVLYHGNLASIRTIMSIYDMCEAYWIASEKCTYGEPYNIGGTEPISVGDFLKKLIERAKCPIKTEQKQSLLRPSDITNQCPDTTKFFKATGWKPKYSIDDCADLLLTEARKVVANES